MPGNWLIFGTDPSVFWSWWETMPHVWKPGGAEYRLLPVVYISKLKRVRKFPDRPDNELAVDQAEQVDFDECLLPEDSWVRELEEGK